MTLTRTLAFIKYIIIKDVFMLSIINRYFINKVFFFLQTFGFLLILQVFNKFQVIRITLNQVNLISNVVLYSKLSNKVILTLKALRRLRSMSPSLFMLLSNSDKGLLPVNYFIKKRSGAHLRGLIG